MVVSVTKKISESWKKRKLDSVSNDLSEALQGPQGNVGKRLRAKSPKEKQPNFHLFYISFLLGLGMNEDFSSFQTFFFSCFKYHCFRKKLKGTVSKYPPNAIEAIRADAPKMTFLPEPSEAEGNQYEAEVGQLQMTLPKKQWTSKIRPAPSPQSSPFQRPPQWKHLTHGGPGPSLPPSPPIFQGGPSLFSQIAPPL